MEFFRVSGSNAREAERFWNFYESKGWLVGKVPMRDWRAAARNWIARCRDEGNGARAGGRSAEPMTLAELSARNDRRLEEMRLRVCERVIM